ncbi:MAG: hypothetical protein QHI38_07740 [Armatimonadota bacterium]|nr:hypothetical protein [Armatimonadota bacterium]
MVRKTEVGDELRGISAILALWIAIWTAAFLASPLTSVKLPCVWEIFEGAGRAAYATGLTFFIVVRVLQAMRKPLT